MSTPPVRLVEQDVNEFVERAVSFIEADMKPADAADRVRLSQMYRRAYNTPPFNIERDPVPRVLIQLGIRDTKTLALHLKTLGVAGWAAEESAHAADAQVSESDDDAGPKPGPVADIEGGPQSDDEASA